MATADLELDFKLNVLSLVSEQFLSDYFMENLDIAGLR